MPWVRSLRKLVPPPSVMSVSVPVPVPVKTPVPRRTGKKRTRSKDTSDDASVALCFMGIVGLIGFCSLIKSRMSLEKQALMLRLEIMAQRRRMVEMLLASPEQRDVPHLSEGSDGIH